jgi:hypothetical protein
MAHDNPLYLYTEKVQALYWNTVKFTVLGYFPNYARRGQCGCFRVPL